MSTNQGAYSAYRCPVHPWIKQLPSHWEERRAKVFFREVNDRSATGKEELLSVSHLTGVTPRSQKNVTMFKAESNVGHKRCQPGDIVINTMWAWMAALGVSRHMGLVSPAYGIYRAHDPETYNPRYTDYLLRSQAYVAEYNCRSTGIQSSRLRLYPAQFLDIPFIRPPRDEQDQIVAYLRAQDAQIARHIKAKRQLIALMAEQRSMLASQAIASQETQYLRFDRVASLLADPIVRKTGETYTPIGMFNRGRGIFHKQLTLGKDLGDSSFFPISKGDLIFSGQFAWEGAVFVAQEVDDGCIASHRYPIVKCKQGIVEPTYLYSLFMVKEGDVLLNHHSRGAAGRNRPLNPRTLMKEKIPIPPLDLQEEIAANFRVEQSVRGEIERLTSHILEYRDRLIADVVTGQLDVRGWVPGPDDVIAADAAMLDGADEAVGEQGAGDDDDGYE